ncbi:unnamed protein product [Meganyctiphanes norvegica]|uniref:G-protein coupled receptors family 1 profile domain-containing protein n=1 Tax=Meganyctiphanes norvegica TaxID=48144 RepID=A0AAV2QT23_MEGNR
MCDTRGSSFIQAKLNETGIVGKSPYFTIVNLSDVIDVIENVENLDTFQIIMEIFVAMFAVFGNMLTIIVLWEVSFTHPAQALRLALAVTDFFTGISHCILAICDHSYFLWCARDITKCDYELDVVLFSNRLEIIRKGYPLLPAIVFMITFTISFAYLVVSAIDRFISIFRPLDYKTIVTMKQVRIQIFFWISLSTVYIFGMITRGDHTSWKSSYRPDDKTTVLFMDPYHYFVNGIIHKCYFLLVIILFLGLISSTLWFLKKAGNRRRALTNLDIKDETEIEMTKTLIFVIFAFLISVIPSYTRHFFGRKVLCNYGNFFVTWLFLSSSTMNFLIYNVRNPAFRRRTFKMLHRSLLTITGTLQTCRIHRENCGMDPNRNIHRSWDSKFIENKLTKIKKPSPNPQLIMEGSKHTQNSSFVNCNTIMNMTNDFFPTNDLSTGNRHNGNNYENGTNISNSDNEQCREDLAFNRKLLQTSVLLTKNNGKQDKVKPSFSTDEKYDQVHVYTSELSTIPNCLQDPKQLQSISSLSKDVKIHLKEYKVEFTLHM